MKYFIWLVALTALLGAVSAKEDGTRDCMKPCPAGNPNDDVYLVPHRNCSQFCSCNYGTAYVLPCPKGLHFSEKDQVCTWPFEAKCKTARQMDKFSASLRTMSLSTGYCFGTCPSSDLPMLSMTLEHEDCDKYCKCSGGIAYLQQCPADFHFSIALGTCTYPAEAHCSRSSQTPGGGCPCPIPPVTSKPIPPPPVTSKPIPPPPPVTSKPIPPPPPVTSKPIPPPPVTSKPIPPPPVTSKPIPPPPPVTSKPITPPPPVTSKPITPPPPPSPVIDSAGCIGVCQEADPIDVEQLPHQSCSKFCKCNNAGEPKVMLCYPGLYYNPNKRVCDYPEYAGCTGIRD